MDALHFVYQMEVLVRRRTCPRVAAKLIQVFDATAAQNYAKHFSMLEGNETAMLVAYLLRMLLTGASDGQALDSKEQLTRLCILAVVLEKHY